MLALLLSFLPAYKLILIHQLISVFRTKECSYTNKILVFNFSLFLQFEKCSIINICQVCFNLSVTKQILLHLNHAEIYILKTIELDSIKHIKVIYIC
mgnify:CR=1 FL=1